ncbi:HD-GYP domain-containing protein (c-di-GMP phosphodiesterase class II) [Janthinobacterium sp. CG_23.3]|uniref:HD-GYP domain-containing protein n=1 Tax=Janthinobacterium sp. CG_23.3 TaxID=3349634 RepID=UPI0038D4BC55
MVQRRIIFSDLVPGAPLPWDLYSFDRNGGPLLRKGQLLNDQGQIDTLLAAGLFVVDESPPSVLHLLNEANKRLERMLHELRDKHNAEHELRDVARDVLRAFELNPDIALACLFLNQIAGTYAVRHCIETALVAILVARGMQKTRQETLVITAAALTMNVGMLRHNDSFQSKHTPLTREEMEIVRRHPEESADLLKCAGIDDEEWISCVMLHHENDDGSGYPGGKTSDEITQNAKLIGLADRYCAHVSARNYRRSVLPDQALHKIFLNTEYKIDPALAEQFVLRLGKYPPGSLVRLRNGEVGVVTAASGSHVHALRDAAGIVIPAALLASAPLRSTSEPEFAIAEALHEDQAGVRFSMKNVWGDQARL